MPSGQPKEVEERRIIILNLVLLKPEAVAKKPSDFLGILNFSSDVARRRGITFHGMFVFSFSSTPPRDAPALAFSGYDEEVTEAADEIIEKYGLGDYGEGYWVTMNPYTPPPSGSKNPATGMFY